jgi:integrase
VHIPQGGAPEPEEERAKALTRAELRVLLAAIPESWRLFFEFLTMTGLRISEAVGLTWAHLDLGERPHVKVREQFYKGERKRLKSRSGRRDVPLSPL